MAKQKYGNGRLLSEKFPEIYAQLHVALNRNYSPDVDIRKLTASSKQVMWFACPAKNHRYQTIVGTKAYYNSGCPICSGLYALPGFNCFRSQNKEMWDQLHLELNEADGINIYMLMPKAPTKVWWQCQVNPDHVWKARISGRTTGNKSGCPHCHTYKNEAEFLAIFNEKTNLTFEAGKIEAKRELFKSDKIQIDILNREHKIAVEYDGHWSHGGNKLYKTTLEECLARDMDSTKSILNAGYTLIRIRQTPLVHLSIEHPSLMQLPYNERHDKLPTLLESMTYLQSLSKGIHLV